MQHVQNIPRHVVTVRPAWGYPTKYALYTFQWTELSLQLISLRWFVKVIITLLLFLLFYNLVITGRLHCWIQKLYPSHVENDNSIMCGNFELNIFCFHWSGKEFRMLCFFAKHDTLHIAMQI